jgi:hypothetical protein
VYESAMFPNAWKASHNFFAFVTLPPMGTPVKLPEGCFFSRKEKNYTSMKIQ